MLNPCCSGRTPAFLSLILLLAPVTLAAGPAPARSRVAELPPASSGPAISGTVTDPSGATVAKATVHIETAQRGARPGQTDVSHDVTTDAVGRFSLPLAPGVYDVTIVAPGFEPFLATVTLTAKSSSTILNAKLAIATQAEIVTVASETPQAGTSAEDNKSALVFDSKQLDTFSDDDDTFQQQLLALAGAGDSTSPPQVFVNGFSNGRFPPKTTIREIRINQNPYSAQYDALGFGRVEIFTKPGSDAFHGGFSITGNDNVLNSPNPYAGAEPSYHLLNFDGFVGGPIGKRTSFFTGATYRDQQNTTAVNATTGLDAGGNPVQTIQAVPDPQTVQTYSVRLDRQMTPNNTFTGRFEFNQVVQINSGVGQLVLPSEGTNSTANTDTLQLSDSQVIGTKTIWETRLQLAHATIVQNPAIPAPMQPTVVVEGAFSGGGSPTQTSSDDQNRGELQEYISRQQGPHFLRIGGRYRFTHEVNASTANFNGQFTFTSIQSYLQTPSAPTQFNLTTGQPSVTLLLQDFDIYAEDEWKVRQNLTLNYGFRFESQTSIPDHADPSPRLAGAWAVGQTDKKSAIVTLRAGGAIFYDRFAASNLLTTLHENGASQQSYIVTNPLYYCTTITLASNSTCPTSTSLTAQTPSIYELSPHLHAEYTLNAGFTAERDLAKKGNINVNYIYYRGVHQYNSANVNAPLPGSGMRPNGGTQNIYQFQSNGLLSVQRFFMNFNLNPTKHIFLWASGGGRIEHTDSAGATSFPSNSYNIAADVGPPAFGNRRLYAGGHYDLPLGFNLNGFVSAVSGTPFNITTGTDLNGDTEYNDRPAFATDLNRSSVVRTRYGNFDTNPIFPGQTIIPMNYATGPAYFSLEVGAGKKFMFGPRPPAQPAPAGTKVASGPPTLPDPRYALNLSLDAVNVLNNVNPGIPVGVLSSPEFGESTYLNNAFTTNSAANRLLMLRASFNF
jgi:hypothetical protein